MTGGGAAAITSRSRGRTRTGAAGGATSFAPARLNSRWVSITSGVKTSPAEQVLVVGLERVEGLLERARRAGDVDLLLGAHLVDVAVDRGRRLDLVDDAVEAGHQLGAEREVRVAGRVRRAELEAARAGRREVRRDPDAGRAVALAVDEVDRRLVAGDEAAVAVRRRRGEREDRLRVLEQAADVVAGRLRQQRVALGVVEEVRAVLPEALVGVHARAVVAEERLRHEGHDLAGPIGRLADDVLVLEDLVGGLDERAVADVDLGLARPADLVVVDLDVDARRPAAR